MKKARSLYTEFVRLVFEKYGYTVTLSKDKKSLFISGPFDSTQHVPFSDIEEIIEKEALDIFLAEVEPVFISSWRINVY